MEILDGIHVNVSYSPSADVICAWPPRQNDTLHEGPQVCLSSYGEPVVLRNYRLSDVYQPRVLSESLIYDVCKLSDPPK